MLRATHRVLKPEAPNCFYVIANTEGLTDADRRRLAEREGNEHVESPLPYDLLMDKAGFVEVEVTDVTLEYIDTLRDWKRAWEGDARGFIELVGEEEFKRRLHNRALDVAHAEEGLVKRYRVFGIKP